MPLHKVPVGLWKQLRLWEGIYSRLPRHYLRSLEEARTPTPVHYRPHGAKFKINPKNWQRERVEDVPIPVHYPRSPSWGCGAARAGCWVTDTSTTTSSPRE